MDNLRYKIVSSSKWSFASEAISKGLSPLLLLVVARLLTPEDFGVVGAATVVISFCQIFWEAGFAKALIQAEVGIEKKATAAFWCNAVMSVVIFILLFVLAPYLALLFSDDTLTLVIRVLGLTLIFSSLSCIYTALFQRGFMFRAIFLVRLFSSMLTGFTFIALALLKCRYWALVGGMLVGSLAQLILSCLLSPWRPKIEFDLSAALKMIPFSMWVLVSGVLTWFYLWADSFVIGAYLNTHDLGLYRTGQTFVSFILALSLSPITPLLFSVFSRMQNDKSLIKASLLRAIRAITMIAFPIGFGLTVISEPLIHTVLGPKWLEATPVVALMAIVQAISWLWGANADAYRAIGKPDIEAKIWALGILYYLPVYLLVAPHGLEPFLWSRLALIFVAFPIHLYFLRKQFSIQVQEFFGNIKMVLIATAIMALIALAISRVMLPFGMLWRLTAVGFSAIIAYTVSIYFLDKEYIRTNMSSYIQLQKR